MRLISWNVNGLRAARKKGFDDFFTDIKADIFCIQETKMQKSQLDDTFFMEGYHFFMHDAVKKGYSGTAIYTKQEPIEITKGLGIDEHDQEGRVITLLFDKFYLVNVYTPNSQRGLERIEYRMEWEDAFRAYLLELEKKHPVIVCGDLNVAHTEIDLARPKDNRKNAGFSDEERGKFTELLNSGFIDTYRHFYPDTTEAYTWWSYMQKARDRNIGWRIDYFLVSPTLKDNLQDAFILPEIYGSDHCPVGLDILF